MKKGFTLIELLGVIIILAMLMLLVFPNIMNILDSGRETIDTAMQTLIETATYNYMEDNRNSFDYTTGDEYCITLQTLVNNNLLKEPITYSNNEEMDLNMFVKVNVTNNEKLSYEVTDTCNGLVISNNMTTMENFRSNIAGLEEQITSLVFENKKNMTAYNNATHKWDLSEIPGNEMVIGYLENNTLHVQANGYVVAPTLFEGDLYVESLNENVYGDYASAFGELDNLEILDLTYLDTRNVTSMNFAFAELRKVTELDISHFNTSKLKKIIGVFFKMESLTDLNLGEFNTSNATIFDWMFVDCKSLVTLDVSSFRTTNALAMDNLFMGMTSLENLDVTKFDTNNVTRMRGTFASLNISTIDLSSFTITDQMDFGYIFFNTNPNTIVYVKDQATVDLLSASEAKPTGLTILVKP